MQVGLIGAGNMAAALARGWGDPSCSGVGPACWAMDDVLGPA
jgi:pyrroline-5-carboxylate reductase